MAASHGPNSLPDAAALEAMERLAVELATLAGTEIALGLGRELAVRYKGDPAAAGPRDPVSEVDQRVEVLIRERLAREFPLHDILGEEFEERPGRNHDTVWAVDPVDGTSNFVNGFPLFAGSVGVLHRGRPVVGAVWCSTSHALRPGVYHARLGGALRFEQEEVTPRCPPAVRRRLIGLPEARPDAGLPYDVRKTGSAAIECAFVAAGLLQAARFARPNIWDVAGGIVLVQAGGGMARQQADDGWTDFDRFEPATSPAGADLRAWRRPLAIGRGEALDLLSGP